MDIFQTLSVALVFASNIWQSASYTNSGPHEKHPNICGGYCRGNNLFGSGPCSSMSSPELEMCEWANDFCCPPNGDGSQWSTTTTLSPNACGGYCISGRTRLIECIEFATRSHGEHDKCLWAVRHCCPPNGDGSQWTTTSTTSTTEKDEDAGKLATWVIVVIAVGAILFVVILVGLGICFCVYFNGQKRKRRVNPGGDATPAYGYPGTGARPGLYQPVIQPQAQFTNDSPFYA